MEQHQWRKSSIQCRIGRLHGGSQQTFETDTLLLRRLQRREDKERARLARLRREDQERPRRERLRREAGEKARQERVRREDEKRARISRLRQEAEERARRKAGEGERRETEERELPVIALTPKKERRLAEAKEIRDDLARRRMTEDRER